jgi:hypothetical protein
MTKNRTISAVIFLERSEEITKWPFSVGGEGASRGGGVGEGVGRTGETVG